MSHMVIYRTAEGQPGYHQTDALDDAVSFVERLRNSDGVDHARIFHMEEVTFDFKPYFRVEVGGQSSAAATVAPLMAPAPEPAPPAVPSFSAPAPVPAPAPVAAPIEEPSWMDIPLMEEPAAEPAVLEPLLMAEPAVLEPLLMAEPAVAEMSPFGGPEQAPPVFEAMPPPPPPPPALDDDESVGSGNGMGARRGLFGR